MSDLSALLLFPMQESFQQLPLDSSSPPMAFSFGTHMAPNDVSVKHSPSSGAG